MNPEKLKKWRKKLAYKRKPNEAKDAVEKKETEGDKIEKEESGMESKNCTAGAEI